MDPQKRKLRIGYGINQMPHQTLPRRCQSIVFAAEGNNSEIPAVAREAQGDEWQAIWERARQIYGGYDAYARRIKDRQIHIMLLSTSPPER